MIPRKDITKELDREIKLRKKLYPKWIQNEQLHEEQAKKQIERLEAALYILEHLTDGQYAKLIDMIDKKVQAKNVVQQKLF